MRSGEELKINSIAGVTDVNLISDFTEGDSAPKVSVVIPCFNHGQYLGDALASVRAQTLQQYEIIVVDDGSNDRFTRDVLEGLLKTDIQVLRIPNQGPAVARNVGIRHAQGQFILPLDADDRIAPNFLEKAVSVLERDPAVAVVYGKVMFFGEETGVWEQPDFSSSRILLENMVVATAVFRRHDWEQAGGYDEAMKYGWEDWDFWLSLVEQGRGFTRLSEIMFFYRIRTDSRDSNLTLKCKVQLMLQMIKNHPSLYLRRMLPAAWALLVDGRKPGKIGTSF